MSSVLVTILSLSISGSILALILVALRPLLKNRVSKTFQYYIWLLVLLRLALPVSFSGSLVDLILPQAMIAQTPAVSASGGGLTPTGEAGVPQGGGPGISQADGLSGTGENGGTQAVSNNPSALGRAGLAAWDFIIKHQFSLWLLGAALHFGWFVIAYLRFGRKVRKTCVPPHRRDAEVFKKLRGNTHVQLACNPYVDTPMLIGFLSPQIIIPKLAFAANGMEAELQHIIQHELTHLYRRDLVYKWLAVFVSSLHWFNPLMLFIRREIGRSCELACDEAVIRHLTVAERQEYGETLLALASNKRIPAGIITTTLCEEKRELKERLESIMTFKRKGVLMIAISLVITLALAGCSVALGAANVGYQNSDVIISEASASADAADEQSPSAAVSGGDGISKVQAEFNDSPLELYRQVLQNEAEFFCTDTGKSIGLQDFLTNGEIYETDFTITRFSVLDMDGDGKAEVVLELSVGNEPQFFEVLHETEGTVFGYLMVYRGLEELKADGTFGYSNGAADYGWGRLRFDADAYTTETMAYSQSVQADTGMTLSYYIGTEQVSEESFDAFQNEQAAKENAAWNEYSEENVETELTPAA